MRLSINVDLKYTVAEPTDVLLQIEAVSDSDQTCVASEIELEDSPTLRELAGDDAVGRRRWLRPEHVFRCEYSATVDVTRRAVPLASLKEDQLSDLPAEVVPYLMPSRFCHSEQFDDFVRTQFGQHTDGTQVQDMSRWITTNFTYDPAASPLGATATDSFHAQAGVCRDYAHVLITFLRAAGIPARFVSVYAPHVEPPDFHAVVEVWLSGAWHIVDPTEMARPEEMVRIGVGRDAADVAFLTSYGALTFERQSVHVTVLQR